MTRISALTSPSICLPLPYVIRGSNYPHLQDLPLADECDKPKQEIDVLIGSIYIYSYYWNLVTSDVVKSSNGPVAVESKLEWLLSGPTDSHKTNVSTACTVINGIPNSPRFDEQNDGVVSSLREFWEVESLGIAPPQ